MTFIVTEKPQSTLSTSTDDSGKTGDITRERVFQVTGPATADNAAYAQATGIPRRGELYGSSLGLWCRSLAVRRVTPILAEITAGYKGATGGKDDGTDNPLLIPADVQFSTIQSEEAIDTDINGDPIMTAAREKLHGLTIPIADLACTITKNLPSFDPTSSYEYNNAVNSDTFLGFPPGVCRIVDINAKTVFTDAFAYWTVGVTFHFRKPFQVSADKAWWKRVKSEGFYALDDNGDYGNALDEFGQNVTSPISIIPTGTDAGKVDYDNDYWITFEVFESKNFSSLGLL